MGRVTQDYDSETAKLFRLGKQPTLDLEWALDPFLAEDHGPRLGGVNSRARRLILGCEPLQSELEATA